MIEELAGRKALSTDDAIVELGDAGLAHVDAGPAKLGRGCRIVGEQRADLAAQFLVDVVAVSALETLDRFGVLEQADLALESRELGFERAQALEPCTRLLRPTGSREQYRAQRSNAGRG